MLADGRCEIEHERTSEDDVVVFGPSGDEWQMSVENRLPSLPTVVLPPEVIKCSPKEWIHSYHSTT